MTSISTKLKARPLFFRKSCDIALILFSIISIIIAIGGMGMILYSVWDHGRVMFDDFSFLTNTTMPNGAEGNGIANVLLGTIYITLGACLISVPLAMGAGIYISEFGKGSAFAAFLRFCANVLMGVPSIIIGLFVYVIVVIPMKGASGLAGSVALAIIMFPVIMRTTEDMLAMVPNTLRESALALGMTRMRTTLCIVTRAAKNGLATGVLLSLARVSGETAPLLFTVLCAYGWPDQYFSMPTPNMPVFINDSMGSAFPAEQQAGWGAALVICSLILIINIATRYFFRDKNKR